MKLIAKCRNCNQEIRIQSFFISDRMELRKQNGNEFTKYCTHCATLNKIRPASVKAENDWIMPAIAIGSTLVVFFALLDLYLGWNHFIGAIILAADFLITKGLVKNERLRIQRFNASAP